MCTAIKEDISNFNKDLRNYKNDMEYLSNVKINPSLIQGNRTTLADYVSVDDIDQSRQNLESRKEVLSTKMNKLTENNKTLKEIVEGMNNDWAKNETQKLANLNLLTTVYDRLEVVLQKVDESDLEKDKRNSSTGEENEMYEAIKTLYDEYINICKQSFEKLTKINTAIGKNEGERIKTLKMYEMFK